MQGKGKRDMEFKDLKAGDKVDVVTIKKHKRDCMAENISV